MMLEYCLLYEYDYKRIGIAGVHYCCQKAYHMEY